MLHWLAAWGSKEEASQSAGIQDARTMTVLLPQHVLTGAASAAVLYKLINWLFA